MPIHSALLTDQYQPTMAYCFYKLGLAETKTTFQMYFRRQPFHGKFSVSAGLEAVIEYLQNYHFSDADLAYLATLKKLDGSRYFPDDFLDYLKNLRFSCDIDAIPEGHLIFPNEPLIRITGPIVQCQLLETPLLNLMNFSTLIATKAARVNVAADFSPVADFGLRRSQGPEGGLMASRACFIGGCYATSNVLAGKRYDIPVVGTMAHSMVMAFDDELAAFDAFATFYPDHSTLLVDTYDTLQGIKHAIQIGEKLRAEGKDLKAIRLDSGDLAVLSKAARKILDENNFKNTKILASGDLDEYRIHELRSQGAPIDVWGVGTRMVTAYDQPALDLVYKLAAIEKNGHWQHRIKVSNTPGKTSTPGQHQVRRYFQQAHLIEDVIYDIDLGISNDLPKNTDQAVDLLVPIFRQGKLVYQPPQIHDIRQQCIQQLQAFASRLEKEYHPVLEPKLLALKQSMLRPDAHIYPE